MTRFTHIAHRARGDQGAAAIEFALVLPVLILLVFGIASFGIGYNRKQGLQAAAREGARLAALPQSTSTNIRAKVNAALDGVLPSGATRTITITPATLRPCDLVAPNTQVTVTVTAPYAVSIPLFGTQTVTMAGKGVFRCE
ncbi:MAG: pilus assembly protein [Actinobacteria bacterium]|nr:pilus assembly protein [Actinomycetota bacterium]